MPRQTIDFGIDLGTTNSAIAVMEGVEPLIIKNNKSQDITPSAVGFTKTGVLQIGDAARRLQLGNAQDAYTEFKRRMGSDYVYQFASSRRSLKPEDLSAEMLKALKGDVEQARGEIVEGAVITVPAAFELHQCDATRRAADLAGLSSCSLLQEPVAAALAYGFQKSSEKAYWLVYDFGGGTFDAALIRAEEGIITVVAHEGDNFLGGSDIDWAILEKLVAPKMMSSFDLPDFGRGSRRWEQGIMKIKSAIEKSKIDVSRAARAPLLDCRFSDAANAEVDLEALGLELLQQDVARIAEPIIAKSVSLVKKVLSAKNLRPSDLHKVILVGGPTQAPYFRAQLQAELGDTIDFSVDPMTVVARGAAVFASTLRSSARNGAPARAGEYSLDLKYKPTGAEPDPLIGGRFLTNGESNFAGFTVQFFNEQSRWNSGQVPVNADGTFTLTLHAEPRVRNHYRIILKDKSGVAQKITPEEMHYTIGVDGVEQPIIHSVGVCTANNGVKFHFAKGASLPQKKMEIYYTAHSVKAGSSDLVLKIPVVEGENLLGDRNRLVGSLVIKGDAIRRDLPEGQEVEVSLHMDESRKVKVVAFIPFLDEEFEDELETGRKVEGNKPAVLKERLKNEQQRMKQLKVKADQAEERRTGAALAEIDKEGVVKDVERKLKEAEGDFVAGEQCDKMLLELACRIDSVENMFKWPALVAEVRDIDAEVRTLAKDSGKQTDQDKAEDLHELAEQHIEAKRSEALQATLDKMYNLWRTIVWNVPAFWASFFRRLEGDEPQMSDSQRARRLLDHGRKAMSENNLAALRNSCLQLRDLLPRDVAEQAQRGWQSGVR